MQKKRGYVQHSPFLWLDVLVIWLGFEPRTHSLEGCCSIQLSYQTISECKIKNFFLNVQMIIAIIMVWYSLFLRNFLVWVYRLPRFYCMVGMYWGGAKYAFYAWSPCDFCDLMRLICIWNLTFLVSLSGLKCQKNTWALFRNIIILQYYIFYYYVMFN